VLLVGDSLTTGQSRGPDGLIWHPYRLRLEELLSTRHPHLHFQVESEAQEGECASDACVKQSLLERVQHRLEQGQYFDLAVIMAGTNGQWPTGVAG
jgi:lysophospholipase L1-like esterase